AAAGRGCPAAGVAVRLRRGRGQVRTPGRSAGAPPTGRLRRRVVVVGAGAVGLAVALELRRAGTEGVLVVDRLDAPGMGSTSRANGGVRAQFSTAVNVEFSRFTIAGLRELDECTGGLVGLRQVGYLFMAASERTESALRRN